MNSALERFPGNRASIGYPRSGPIWLESVEARLRPLSALAGKPLTETQRRALRAVIVVDPDREVRGLAHGLLDGIELPMAGAAEREWLEKAGFDFTRYRHYPFDERDRLQGWLAPSDGPAPAERLRALRWLAQSAFLWDADRETLRAYFAARGEPIDTTLGELLNVWPTDGVSQQLRILRGHWAKWTMLTDRSRAALPRLLEESPSAAVRALVQRMIEAPGEPAADDLLAWSGYEPGHRRRDARASAIDSLVHLPLVRRDRGPSALPEALRKVLRDERSAVLRAEVERTLARISAP